MLGMHIGLHIYLVVVNLVFVRDGTLIGLIRRIFTVTLGAHPGPKGIPLG